MTHQVPPDPVPAEEATDPRWRLSRTKIVVAVILLVAIVVPLLVGTYARVEPRLFGFPFFYWYQLLWVFLAAGLVGLCFVLLERERRDFSRGSRGGPSRSGNGGYDRTDGGAGATGRDAR